jgi:hypothetical protein
MQPQPPSQPLLFPFSMQISRPLEQTNKQNAPRAASHRPNAAAAARPQVCHARLAILL